MLKRTLDYFFSKFLDSEHVRWFFNFNSTLLSKIVNWPDLWARGLIQPASNMSLISQGTCKRCLKQTFNIFHLSKHERVRCDRWIRFFKITVMHDIRDIKRLTYLQLSHYPFFLTCILMFAAVTCPNKLLLSSLMRIIKMYKHQYSLNFCNI